MNGSRVWMGSTHLRHDEFRISEGSGSARSRRVSVFAAIAVLAAISCHHDPPRPAPSQLIDCDLVREDLAVVREAITEGHAALHRYRSRGEVEAILDGLEQCPPSGATPIQLWAGLSQAFAALEDGHLTALPSAPLYEDILNTPGRFLPLTVRVIDGSPIVIDALPTVGIAPGCEIASINGVPGRELIATLERMVPADGSVKSRKRHVVGRDFSQLLAFHFGFLSEYSIQFHGADGSKGAAMVRTLPWRSIRELRGAPFQASTQGTGMVDVRPDSVAILRLSTFAAGREADVDGFLESAFETIRGSGARTLILDIRKNGGGRDANGALLFSYIAERPFRYAKRRTLNRKHYEFLEGTPEWPMNFRLKLLARTERPDGRFDLDEDLDQLHEPKKGAFLGRVLLLADGSTFSVGCEVAALFKGQRRGEIIGEECGNAYQGDSGATVGLELPNSGLIINVPIVEYELDVPPIQALDRGVLPDVEIVPSANDVIAGTDVVLAEALRRAIDKRR